MRNEIVKDLNENILPFWKKYSADSSGGFYGALNRNGSPVQGADKGCVLNARILWTFSADYRLTGDKKSLQLANRAQHYFIGNFFDNEYGGVYWSLNADGSPKDTGKQTYGIAFGIYGLSEHYRATRNSESLRKAVELYNTLETNAFDQEYGGYTESFTRKWEKPERYGYDGKGIAPKTMNTHIHVLEAYSNLYRIWKDDKLRKQLKGLIKVMTDKIYNHKHHHLMLYFNNEWKSLEDIDSYGHDIETSWLLVEAAGILDDPVVKSRVKKIALELVDASLTEGMNSNGSLIYERNGTRYRRNLSWWCQAESVNGLLNAWHISGNEKYLDAAEKTWEWIKNNMIDEEYGEWFRMVYEDSTPDTVSLKASMWHCPYHNSRMGFKLEDTGI